MHRAHQLGAATLSRHLRVAMALPRVSDWGYPRRLRDLPANANLLQDALKLYLTTQPGPACAFDTYWGFDEALRGHTGTLAKRAAWSFTRIARS